MLKYIRVGNRGGGGREGAGGERRVRARLGPAPAPRPRLAAYLPRGGNSCCSSFILLLTAVLSLCSFIWADLLLDKCDLYDIACQ